MAEKKKNNEQWENMQKLLFESDARCLWQQDVRTGAITIECWLVSNITVIFTNYHQGGFDVYTPHQSPREIDQIIPWLLEEAGKQ